MTIEVGAQLRLTAAATTTTVVYVAAHDGSLRKYVLPTIENAPAECSFLVESAGIPLTLLHQKYSHYPGQITADWHLRGTCTTTTTTTTTQLDVHTKSPSLCVFCVSSTVSSVSSLSVALCHLCQ